MTSACSRRNFFKHGIAAGLAVGTPEFLAGCGSSLPTNDPEPLGMTPTDRPARVVAVRGAELRSMTREALASFGGAGAIVRPGETVFLKPNLVGAGMVKHPLFATGECTKPEVFLTVAEECLKAGARRVILGDGGQVMRFSWEEMLLLDGSDSVAKEVQWLNDRYDGSITLACLNADSPAWDPVPSPYSGLGQIYVSSLVTRADRIISLPVLKTHRFAQLTLSLKNFMGVTSAEFYGAPGLTFRAGLHDAPGGLEQSFLDIVAGLRPDFTLIDCSIGCEGNGPHVMPGWWGKTVDMRERLGDWLLLASDDLVAADAIAARIIDHGPADVLQLSKAFALGLGQLRDDRITLDGASLDELRVDWEPAEIVSGFGEVTIEGLAMLLE